MSDQNTPSPGKIDSLRRRAYALVEPVSAVDLSTTKYDLFDIFIVVLIFLNIVAIILHSLKSLALQYSSLFRDFEFFSIVVFTFEYLLRLWSCPVNPKYRRPVFGRLKLVFSPMVLIDLLAILPFYLPLLLPVDLRFLRALRLLRIFRIAKIGRYSESLHLFGRVFKSRRTELGLSLFLILILLVVSSSLLFFFEESAQPDKFKSIPDAMWWGVVTLTTVGYGDIYPITPVGKLFSAVISILGIAFFALPAGIMSAGFIEELRAKRAEGKFCPHCGERID
jgi:voltage-gated potassium channel